MSEAFCSSDVWMCEDHVGRGLFIPPLNTESTKIASVDDRIHMHRTVVSLGYVCIFHSSIDCCCSGKGNRRELYQ